MVKFIQTELGRIKVEKQGTTMPILKVSKVPEGLSFFSEPCVGGLNSPGWIWETVGMEQMLGIQRQEVSIFQRIIQSYKDTSKTKQMGEVPSYTMYTAKAITDEEKKYGNKITFFSHFTGDLQMIETEKYPVVYAKKGAFLCGIVGVRLSLHVIENIKVVKNSAIGNFMQEISGKGVYWLEAHGDIIHIDLYPNESVDARPGRFLAMTKGIKIELISVEDIKLKKQEGDFRLRFTAGTEEGRVWFQSMLPKDRELSNHLE